MKINKYISRLFACISIGFLCVGLFAQEAVLPGQIKGKVVNEYDESISGVLITTENGKNECLTGADGTYVLSINDGSRFVIFSARGYKDQRMVPDLSEEINIKLEYDAHHTGGTVSLGYFTQSRDANVGAISTVTGTELDKSPVSNLSQTLAGRLAGLYTMESYSELNYSSVLKLVRGISTTNGNEPLVIIDGVICPNVYYEYISPKEIEDITILKDASTTSIYGIQGANGAIVITTKRGHIGKRRISVYLDQAFQQMTKQPKFVNSFDYAQLRNQAGVNDGLGNYSQFSQTEAEGFGWGADPLYSNNDWYDMFMKKMTMMQRVGVNISGGTERIKYFSNVNYMHQSTPFKVADESDRNYDPTPDINSVNFRSNLDLNFNRYLSAFMKLSGNVTFEKSTPYSNSSIYGGIFSLPPTMYGPLTPPNDTDPEAGNQVVTHDEEDNPTYGLLNRSGYAHWLRTNVMAQAGITVDMSFLTQGLSLTGMMSYQTYSNNITYTRQEFARYVRTNDYTKLDFTKKGATENTPLAYSKGSIFFYNMNLFGNMNYKRRFGDHSIDAMAYIYYLQQEKQVESGAGILPYKRQSVGVTALYGYKDRYFIKGDIGYSGSEQFHPDRRYIATPAIGLAWLASKEGFMADLGWLSLLKLRASYGITASDQLGSDRFLYLDYIDSNGNERLRGNPDLSAEKIEKQNYGIDLGFLNSISVTFDYFIHNVDNMLVNSSGTIPIYQGIPLDYYPKLNNGKMENKGFEIEANYNKRLTRDWSVFVGAGFSHSKNKVINVNESPNSEDYAHRYRTEGYSLGQQWGYLIDYSNGNGMFNSADEKNNKKLTYDFGTPRVGDFIYQDLNNDGIIDEKDKAPIGNCWLPENYYSITGGFSYKGFEFSFLFQGTGKSSYYINGIGAFENEKQGVFNDIHMNAWTPERYANGEKIDYPALSLTKSTNHVENSYFIMDRSYLRLRNVEIAYTLPSNISKKIAAERIRFSLNAQNLFTIDNMKTKYIDPEIASMSAFQPYRVYNIGVSLNF